MPSYSPNRPYPEDYVAACLKDIVAHIAAADAPRQTGPDDFPIFDDTDHTFIHRRINNYLTSALKGKGNPAGVVASVAAVDQWELLHALLIRLLWWRRSSPRLKKDPLGLGTPMWVIDSGNVREALSSVAAELLQTWRKKGTPKLKPRVVAEVLKELAGPCGDDLLFDLGGPALVASMVEHHIADDGISTGVREGLACFRDVMKPISTTADRRKILQDIASMLGEGPSELIERGEAWSDAALGDLGRLKQPRSDWDALMSHCLSATSSKPTGKWLKEAARLTDAIGQAAFTAHIARWFTLVGEPRTQPIQARSQWQPDPNQLISERNQLVLRGLAWACAHHPGADVTRALSHLSEQSFKKIRNLGPRCPKVGNACLWALSNMQGDDAVSRLSTLAAKVKQPTARKMIGKALGASAERHGKSVEELQESTVPDFGLDETGALTRTVGNHTVELRLDGFRSVGLTFIDAKGATRANVPADVKRTPQLNDLQKLAKDITAALAAIRHRLETALGTARQWSFADFQAYYIDHRFARILGRRLIWELVAEDPALFTWHDGTFVDVRRRKLKLPRKLDEARVRLWHPISSPADTVLAWRQFLEQHTVTQPFKQAHREVYALTDAERRARTYSNRFAAHLLRQHQLRALCQERGWKYNLQGSWDGYNCPTLQIPHLGLSASFTLDARLDGDESPSGVSLIVTTDAVSFAREQQGDDGENEESNVALTDIPPLVLSEVFRDVDLFVGVCSIGADPLWRDHQEAQAAELQYWENYAFGDLDAAAHIRRDLLSRLLPRLKIADRCRLDDRHLVVSGRLRVYKIHLRSGNILMEPNNAYLCIVPSGKSTRNENILLPFEGDTLLSVIISKAFLLADDTNITDPSILSQIKGR